jgi:hypothetical protein
MQRLSSPCAYHRINGFRNVQFQLYINILIIISVISKEQARQIIFFLKKNVNKKISFRFGAQKIPSLLKQKNVKIYHSPIVGALRDSA